MTTKTTKAIPNAKPPGANANSHSANTSSLQFSLPQMLDLALGTPEVGAVNLNILHNFLHVLLHQVNLRATKVEYRGEDAVRLQNVVTSARTGPSLHLHEYNIIESSGRVKQRIHSNEDLTVKVDVYTEEAKVPPSKSGKSGKPAASAPASARGKGVQEQGSEVSLDTKNSSMGNGAKKTKGMKQQVGGRSESEAHSVIFVEPIIDGAVPTALRFKQLEDTINKLQADFRALEELANTQEMVERIKTNSTDPMTDMWHIINMTKRLDAAENGIDKMTTMVQDLIKSDKVLTLGGDGAKHETVAPQLTEIESRLTELERLMTSGGSTDAGEVKAITADRKVSLKVNAEINSDVATLKTEIAQLRNDLNELTEKIGTSNNRRKSSANTVTQPRSESGNTGEDGAKSKPEVSETKTIKTEVDCSSNILDQIHELEVTYGNTTQDLVQRVQELEKDVGCLMEKMNSAPMAGVSAEGSQGVADLLNKIQTIQSDMENINQTANRLLDDRETRETHTNALLEQIELLKTIKADKEDLEGALADKADARAVNRKVSYDQFDAACDDLARGLEEAVTKLAQQEGIWQKALDDVQLEIEGKLDKIEISPLKEFVNNKLKTLQEKLKTLSELRRESEAAGTKKLLRDVQCISCDKNVVMKMQEGAVFHAEPMPCTKSIKPYLTYELDQVRKQQRRLPHGRNMIQFEAAMQEEARKVRAVKDDNLAKSPRDHLCNRYCGGSHTVTTPQQRVMRMGHFLTQWGPEAIQLTEGVIRGTDGQFYRSRTVPGAPDICGPQESGSQGKTEEVTPPTPQVPEPRAASISSSRGGETRTSVGRSGSNVKPSGSVSQRRLSVRRSTGVKLPTERTSMSVSAPKVSQEVITEEPKIGEGEKDEEEKERDESEAEEDGRTVAEVEPEEQAEVSAPAMEESSPPAEAAEEVIPEFVPGSEEEAEE